MCVFVYLMPHFINNKAIVDSRLCPQWCFHLANVNEIEEMLDCKLDALIRSFAFEKKQFSCQHKSAVSCDLWPWPWHEHTVDARWPGVHRVQVWCRSGHLPARSDWSARINYISYIIYIVYIAAWQTYRQTDCNTSPPPLARGRSKNGINSYIILTSAFYLPVSTVHTSPCPHFTCGQLFGYDKLTVWWVDYIPRLHML